MIKYIPKFYTEIDESLIRYVRQLPLHQTYNDPQLKKILIKCHSKVEELFGVELIPTYCFLTKYKQGDELKIHRDRAACEYSVSMCIETNVRWPLHFQHPETRERAQVITQNTGDAVLYKGRDLSHWRRPLIAENGFQNQFFLHYVDANGEHTEQAGDYHMQEFMKTGDKKQYTLAKEKPI